MKNKKKFWTPTKVIVTILIVILLLFILYKIGLFNTLLDKFLTTSVPTDTPSVGAMSNGGGGIK